MQGIEHILEIASWCLHEDHSDQIVHFNQLLSQSCNYIYLNNLNLTLLVFADVEICKYDVIEIDVYQFVSRESHHSLDINKICSYLRCITDNFKRSFEKFGIVKLATSIT